MADPPIPDPTGRRYLPPGDAGRTDTEAFTEAAIGVLKELRPGEVVSYGEVAEQAGFPGAARAVGNLLKHTDGLPWWRVVAANGRLVPGGEIRQARLLRAEGVTVKNGKVVGEPTVPHTHNAR
ncbi:MAG: MGMT family protein [bacterium]|nr:MGMT family protein [bacterium]